MAEPVTTTLAVKAALAAAQDKRVQKVVLALIAGIIFLLLLPLLLITSVFSGAQENNRDFANIIFKNGEIPNGISAEYVGYITEMKSAFAVLDTEISIRNGDLTDESLDDIRIKAFFYSLYYGKDLTFEDDFYSQFVGCFIDETVSDDGSTEFTKIIEIPRMIANISLLIGKDMTEQEKTNANDLYYYIKYGFAPNSSFGTSGIPSEAFDDETFAQLMGEATKYIGFPYVWGGSSPSTSFDCSGFVCWSYTQSGVYNLPRTTAQGILNQCTPISADEAKAGDLIFFHSTYQTDSDVTHIGIYVGNGQMLHCGDPIGYSNINTTYWIQHFYSFGRLS